MPVSRSAIVLDASVAMRAFVDEDGEARGWFRKIHAGACEGVWPELVFVEVGHGLTRLVRARRLEADRAARALGSVLSAELETASLLPLAQPALRVALDRGISAYDACYVVLAETLGTTLVTADRRLAAATDDAVLLGR
jgi:predicted nucleic acid-binding protein